MGMSDLIDDSEYVESDIDEYDRQMDKLSDDEFYHHTLFDEYHGQLSDEEDVIPTEKEISRDLRFKEEEMNDYDELED